jgi:hypothetical protein
MRFRRGGVELVGRSSDIGDRRDIESDALASEAENEKVFE